MRELRVRPAAPVAAVLFAVLTVLVATHVTEHLDTVVLDWLVPVGSWNDTHQLFSDIPDWTAPQFQLVVFFPLVALIALRRRSWTPLVVAFLLLFLTAVPELAVKHVVPRVDTGGHNAAGGSFPSGHMAITVMTVGGLLILFVARTRWWQWVLVSLLPLGMAFCLLYGAIHWLTDCVGGALLGVVALGIAAGVPGRAGVSGARAADAAPRPVR